MPVLATLARVPLFRSVPARTYRQWSRIAGALAILLSLPWLATAQDGTNVLLVVNTTSAVSDRVAARYRQARAVPAEHVVRVTTDTADEITRTQYERDIERPIAEWLTRHSAQDRILYIVLTKGMPLRVGGTTGRSGTVASVDSELTLLYRKLVGMRVPVVGSAENPYFGGARPVAEARPFAHEAHDIYLVSRLDGFDEADVMRLIDSAASASSVGDFLLDTKGTPGDPIADGWLRATAEALSTAGYANRVVLEMTATALRNRKNVLGYASWGSNDPALHTRRLGIGFLPGALATMLVSTDARTLREPPAQWQPGTGADRTTFFEGSPQSLTGDLVRDGVTGVGGYVAEPFLDGTLRPDTLFPAYVAGFNLVESFYLAMPHLSWQTVVFGDPLCAPFRARALSTDEATPALDAETELPAHFSRRRVAFLAVNGISEEAVRLMLKGEARRRDADRAGARQAFERATALEPRLTAAHRSLARIYEELGEYDRAIDRYRLVLTAAPSDPLTLNNLAYALAVYKSTPAEALPLAEKAYAASKGQAPLITDTLGWIHHLLGNQVEAERLLAEAASAAADNAEIQLHLAYVYAAQGRKAPALAALARGLQLDATLTERDDVRKLQAQLGSR